MTGGDPIVEQFVQLTWNYVSWPPLAATNMVTGASAVAMEFRYGG